jgi:hypothetical protein
MFKYVELVSDELAQKAAELTTSTDASKRDIVRFIPNPYNPIPAISIFFPLFKGGQAFCKPDGAWTGW